LSFVAALSLDHLNRSGRIKKQPEEPKMPEKRYTKVEEEVIQILDRLESERPAPSRPNLRLVEPPDDRRPRRSTRRIPKPSFRLSGLTAGRPWIWIVSALGLAFAAIVVRDTSDNLALVLAVASILAFFAPLFVGRRGSGSGPAGPSSIGRETKQWRGRDISFEPPSGPSPGERVSRWFQNRRRGGPRL
jgi:hypothetical protein